MRKQPSDNNPRKRDANCFLFARLRAVAYQNYLRRCGGREKRLS